ncbi:MAG: hypothetical protein K6E93_06025 [Bacteroidales bacterium]|nr:hypothetical protein [Bacteroidales bacterium]
MKEKEIDNNHLSEEEQQTRPTEPVVETESTATVDDDIASAADIEAYTREVAARRAKKMQEPRLEEEDPEKTALAGVDEMGNTIDPYMEPDPTLPNVVYKESLFLSRGCNHCPKPYVPVEEQEMRSCCKVGASNWMKGIRKPLEEPFDVVEVRFKNNRKEFFRMPDGIDVSEGDVVAVEGVPGHDVGIVSLMGEACRIQMKRKKVNPDSDTLKKLFRRAKPADIEKWAESLREENAALLKTRRIAEDLGLSMKVNDVEYQGDHSKAIFYYTADDRVDFRALIKVLAEEFRVRVEMKQIGVRQEAGKVGGIGSCGRELCCSTWLTNFKSVTTGVAKAQQILPNPQKLAGQCGKLKCCLNFEYEVYVDALKQFPPANQALRFQKGLALYKKTDVFRGIMWYAYEGESDLYAIPAESVKKIIAMNKEQQYPEKLEDFQVELMSTSALVQETTTSEFERELRSMADNGNETVAEDNSANQQQNRHNRDKHMDRHGNERRQRNNERRGADNREGERRQRDDQRNNRPERRQNNGDRPRRDNRPENRNHDRNYGRKEGSRGE